MVDVMVLLIANVVVSILVYAYFAVALQFIAKKTGTPHGWFAWIPFLNLVLLANIANMYWWPILVIPVIYGLGFIPLEGIIIPIITLVVSIGLIIYLLTLWEKTFKRVGMSGWWVLAFLVPILNFVAVGLAAWGKGKATEAPVAPEAEAKPEEAVAPVAPETAVAQPEAATQPAQ